MQLSSAAQAVLFGSPLIQLSQLCNVHDLSGQVKIVWHTCLGLIDPTGKAHVYFASESNRLGG